MNDLSPCHSVLYTPTWCRTASVVVQLPNCVQLFVTSWTVAHQASLSLTISQFAQIHVHWISDAIQPSNLLLSSSPPAFNHSQHQALFKWVSSLHQVAKVLEFQLHQSFQWTPRTDLLWDGLAGSLSVQGTLKSLLQNHSSKHKFISVQLSLQSNSHSHTWLLEKP